MPAKVLLTGVPGIGKTTVIREVARLLGADAAGFYTEETRAGGRRAGFDIITLDGQSAVLSRVKKKSRFRVGRYAVDIEAVDSIAVSSIKDAIERNKTIIIDEIGKMELFSEKFRESVKRAFDSPNPTVAVIMLKSNPFADSIKQRPDVELIEVTLSNRNSLPQRIAAEIGKQA
jgi:nucleoside-triphosphatase